MAPPLILCSIICISIASKIFLITSLRVQLLYLLIHVISLRFQVKKVFVDGLPASWDEDRVRDLLKKYGKIEKIELARNMPSAKRKDFGFITFDSHDAAVTCAKNINNTELGEGESKVSKVDLAVLLYGYLLQHFTDCTFVSYFIAGQSSSQIIETSS